MESLSRKAALYASGHLPESGEAKMDDNAAHQQGWSVEITMKRILLTLLTVAFAGTASAQLYKWMDNNGRVQYGDTPPGDATKVTRLRAPSPGAAPAPAATPASADAKKEAAKDKEKPLTPEEAFQKRQKERAETEQKEAKERADAAAKRQNCETAQADQRALESGARLTKVNGAGEPVVVDDDARARDLQRARKAVAEWCN
jgi:uncharacterized protein DUF4124